ncbi:MAG TPA: NAD(P)H-binding protein [Acidobacteriota bacterium]|nr:NAD(P)H-binding protein [Acidobacteriota bacterium]
MQILVIGGTGMLGEPVARRLQADGHTVRLLARSPEKARAQLGDGFAMAPGDVEDPESIRRALDGCEGVHINLNGGPTMADYDRIEHRGTANVAQAAATAGVSHLTYLAGISAYPHNAHFPPTAAKLNAIAAIQNTGLPYTVFRAQWFFESLPLFVKNGQAVLLGRMPNRWHWLAAADYARMVARAYKTPEAKNQVFDIVGPEPLSLAEALERYHEACLPGTTIRRVPFWEARLLAFMTGNRTLELTVEKMRFWDRFEEVADAEPANRVLGTPEATLTQWLTERQVRS